MKDSKPLVHWNCATASKPSVPAVAGVDPVFDGADPDPFEHPAATTWTALQAGNARPEQMQILKVKAEPKVYRLAKAGPGGCDVIAKRCSRGAGESERMLYQEVLPWLPFISLRCYGFVEAAENDGGGPSWLFLEDAGGEEYSPLLEEHRFLASRWLGEMHAAAAGLAAATRFPDRSPACYLRWLRHMRGRIVKGFGNPSLKEEHQITLQEILRECDVLEEHWSEIECLCDRMPRTLVHGDLSFENIRVRNGNTIVVMDWETVGWGVPAVDFAQMKGLLCPDVAVYHSTVQSKWPSLDLREMEEMARVGTIFRLTFDMAHAAQNLQYNWARKSVKHLSLLEAQLADSVRAAGWSSPGVGRG